MSKLTYRLEVAGIPVQVRNEEALQDVFKEMGAIVISFTDKSLEMQFPTDADANRFRIAAERNGAIFE